MDPDGEVDFDFSPFLIRYKSGRVGRAPLGGLHAGGAVVGGARLFVAGGSAGANIAHQVTLRTGWSGGARIEGMVLLHPYFRGRDLLPSELADPELLGRADLAWTIACAGRYDMDHPFINPLAMPAAEWAALGCRRALVTVAELDALRDRGRRYVEALREGAWAGEEAVLYGTPGEGHVYFIDKPGGGGEGDGVRQAINLTGHDHSRVGLRCCPPIKPA